ncbi:MAG: hypothetical protein ACI9C3_001028, partial [Yoonia sp.]
TAGQWDEWFFCFVILDHLSHKLIHLNYWSEFPRPPLSPPLDLNLLSLLSLEWASLTQVLRVVIPVALDSTHRGN